MIYSLVESTSKDIKTEKEAKGVAREQQMLYQLHTLKNKNDNIQTNIQKAIDVIEDKMINILSK